MVSATLYIETPFGDSYTFTFGGKNITCTALLAPRGAGDSYVTKNSYLLDDVFSTFLECLGYTNPESLIENINDGDTDLAMLFIANFQDFETI